MAVALMQKDHPSPLLVWVELGLEVLILKTTLVNP